jgi:WD40 repeat protein
VKSTISLPAGRMMMRFGVLQVCKKRLSHLLGFLFALAVSWYVWIWIVPPRPRALIVPFSDSDFVAFTADSRVLITREPQWHTPPGATRLWDVVSRPSRIQVWDTQDGALLRTLSGEWAEMDRVIPARDSRRLFCWAGGTPEKSPDLIKTCDLLCGEVIERAAMPAKYLNCVALELSPDDKWLGIAPTSGYVGHFKLWRIGSNNLIRFDGEGPRLTFSEPGGLLAASGQGAWDFTVAVWELDDPARLWKRHKWSADDGFVFPECRTAATYHSQNFRIAEAKLWDLATGQLLASFPAGEMTSHIRFLDFPADGRILTDYVDGTPSTAIWDVSGQPKLIAVLKEWKIAVSADRNWMLQSEERGVHLIDLRCGTHLSLTRSDDAPTSNQGAPGQFSPDSRMVLVTGIRHEMKLDPILRWINLLLPNIASEGWRPVARLWQVETGAELAAFSGCTKAVFSPDSKLLATFDEEGTVRLWDVPSVAPIWLILASGVALWLLGVGIAWCWKKLRLGVLGSEECLR